jgi:hypothetical protein
MRLTIELTGLACEITGVKEISLTVEDSATYGDIICRLRELHPEMSGVIISEKGETLLSSVLLCRNGTTLVMPAQMGESPGHGDRLTFIFVIVGG